VLGKTTLADLLCDEREMARRIENLTEPMLSLASAERASSLARNRI
jgi:hypothetical protein